MRVGKGLLIVSTHTVADTKEMREDVARQLALEEGGFRLHQFSQEYEELEEFHGASLEPLFGAPAAKVKNGALPLALPKWGTAVWRVK